MKKSSANKSKVVPQSSAMRKVKSIKLTDEQYEKWDKKIHPEFFRYIIDNNITLEDLQFLVEIDIKELMD